MKLFSVFLGGRAKKCNTELHDVVFTCGETIKDTYYDLLDKWFGFPDRLHIDSWVEISIIDGYKVTLKKEKSQSLNKLYFINLGAYDSNKFEELHESKFMVGMEINTIKNRAIKSLLIDMHQVHTDDLYDVDNCIEIIKVSNLYVHLEKTDKVEKLKFNNGYFPIPRKIINEYKSNQ